MNEHRTEERVREALQSIRAQSSSEAHHDHEALATLHTLTPPAAVARREPRRILAAAAAVLLVVAAVGLLSRNGRDDATGVTATAPERGSPHATLVALAAQECRDYQRGRPADPAPENDLPALAEWVAAHQRTLADARNAVAGLEAATAEDRQVLAKVESNLRRQQEALEAARTATAAGDELAAIREVDRARSYESIVAFELAEWGATECDARGVTRPTR